MNFYSYDMNDPVFSLYSYKISIQIFTLENIYGLDPDSCTVFQTEERWTLHCDGLTWAGQQERSHGELILDAEKIGDGDRELKVIISAKAPSKIRCIKLLVRDLPVLELLDMNEKPVEIPDEGIILSYPGFDCRMPLMAVRLNNDCNDLLGIRCEDSKIRQKRFAIYSEKDLWGSENKYAVELIHEEDARFFSTEMVTPPWIIERTDNFKAFVEEHLKFCENNYKLLSWGKRQDVPNWMHEVSLCASLHGMHWSGYIFNTYCDMLDILRYIADRIDPKWVLVFLPGWEGRYYWQYGECRPEPRLGGEESFGILCREAVKMGFHLMPMVGGNCVNSWLNDFQSYGPDAYMKSATRMRYHGNAPDWSQDRSHDTGWQAWLNPGHPSWQRKLSDQIHQLADKYGWDGIFLDTIHVWSNDPDHNIYEGICQLVAKLHTEKNEFLVAAEDWWDALTGLFPLFQNDGINQPMTPYWFEKYSRIFSFLGHVEPARSSGGVQHMRYLPYERPPLSKVYIPTVSFINDTLILANNAVDEAIQQGIIYHEKKYGNIIE